MRTQRMLASWTGAGGFGQSAAHIPGMSPAATKTPRKVAVGPQRREKNGEFGEKDWRDADVQLPPVAETEETVFTRRYDSSEDKIDAFMGELQTKIDSLSTDEEWQEWLDFVGRFHHYSMNNQLLILMQKPDATRVAGYNEWKKLGRQVRKGEKGIGIMRPRKVKVELLDNAGRPMLDEKGKPRSDYRIVGVAPATVFDISQTDGPEIPQNPRILSEEPPAGFVDDLQQAIADQGFTLTYGPTGAADRFGYTTVDGSKQVVIKDGLNAGTTARVLAHELGHILAGHIDHGDEYHTGEGGQRGVMEVEADAISYVLLRSNGMSPDIGRANATYVSGWSKHTANLDSVKAAGKVVAAAVRKAFDDSKWRNAEAF